MTNQKLGKALAGITLCAYKRDDGVMTDYFGVPLMVDEFPQEIEILGKTFTLEDVSEESVHPEKGLFYNAEYC